MKRIATLTPGEDVTLRTATGDEPARFLRHTDEGTAVFLQHRRDGTPYEWEAYRYNGRWSYGTSAQRLSLVQPTTTTPEKS